jgi:hypothetical protein
MCNVYPATKREVPEKFHSFEISVWSEEVEMRCHTCPWKTTAVRADVNEQEWSHQVTLHHISVMNPTKTN